MISTKIWETPLSWHVKCSLPVAVRVSKPRMLKLPISPAEPRHNNINKNSKDINYNTFSENKTNTTISHYSLVEPRLKKNNMLQMIVTLDIKLTDYVLINVDFLPSDCLTDLINALSEKSLFKHVVQFSLICFVLAMQTDPETDDGNPEASENQPTDQDMDQDDEWEKLEENDWFEDPTWSPEKIDHDYEQIKDEDDTGKIHDNPR